MAEDKKATLREHFFQESFQLGQKMRHGMFSMPISTAIGDDTYCKAKVAHKDQDGRVVTEPKNFTTKKVKKGHTDDVLFSKPSYISTGDPFKEAQGVPKRNPIKETFKEAGHELNFKPAKTFQRKVKADFDHLTDYVPINKNRKGPDGAVVTEPRNFLTNPPKEGEVGKGTSFGGNLPHMPDEYERRKELARRERIEHEKKVQEKPFSQRIRGIATFASVKEAFGEDRVYPKKKPNEKHKPLMSHDAPFKPSNPPKTGYNKTIDKFPEYKPDPMKFAVRNKSAEAGEDRGKWKPSHDKKTVPTPSVTTNYKNLKSEFPTVFRRL